MARELKVDRVKFQEDLGAYFRDTPTAPFPSFDNGTLQLEQPETYADCTDLSGIDMLIVKEGTNLITHDDYRRTVYNMKCSAEDLTRVRVERGLDVLLISSGAIGLGRKTRLRIGEKIPEEEKDTPEQKQKDAVVGQPMLYELWRHHFYPQLVEESLVTHQDLENLSRRNGLLRKYDKWLYEVKIPVINEHDAKSLEEIEVMLKGEPVFSDNDGLASLIAIAYKKAGRNPLLVFLGSTDGIYTAESVQSDRYTPIRVVKDPANLEEQAAPISSTRGRGGIISRTKAIRSARSEGVYTVVANGQYCNHDAPFQEGKKGSQRRYNVLDAILDGKVVGTRSPPVAQTI